MRKRYKSSKIQNKKIKKMRVPLKSYVAYRVGLL